MTLEQIKNFIALADFRNFTKAAERSFISQSTLSRSVASLESSLGIKLLERDTRYVTLTEAGEYLREEGNRILDELYMLEIRLKDMAEGKFGHLLVLTTDFSFPDFSNGCHSFTQEYPDVELELEVERSWQVPERIIMREADIGLTFAHETDSTELEMLSLRTDTLSVLVPEYHRFADRKSITLDELEPNEILFYGDSAFEGSGNGTYSPSAPSNTAPGPKYHIISSMGSALQRMYAGQGVVILPTMIGSSLSADGNCRLLSLDGSDDKCQLVLVYRKDNSNPALGKFLEVFLKKDRT
jgi:DNA-binding transcriptional LysR family regulator